MIGGNIIDTTLNHIIYELREHRRDTTLPTWYIIHHTNNLSLYVSMIVASVRFIVATTSAASLMNPDIL